MSRKIKSGGTIINAAIILDRTKTYTYDATGNIVEVDGTSRILGDNDIVFSGSKSNLRRMADLERNVSVLATRLVDGSTFSENFAADIVFSGSVDFTGTLGSNFTEKLQDIIGNMVSSNTETGIAVTYDDASGKLNFSVVDSYVNTSGDTMSGTLNMGSNLITNVSTPVSTSDAATKGYVDTAVSGEIANVAQYTSWFFSDGTNLSEIGDSGSLVINPGNNITISYNATSDEYTISSTDTNTTYSAGAGIGLDGNSFYHADTSTATSLTASGRRYVTGLTFDTYGHVTGYTTGTETVTDTNNYLTGLSLATGTLTATRSGLANVSVDLTPLTTGLASTSYVDTAIANLVNGADAAYDTLKEIQDAMATDAELSSAISALTIGDATITISAGSGLTTGGSFTTNATSNSTITLAHADTSSQASVNNSNGVVIQDVTLDTYGHVTGLVSTDLDNRYVNVTGDTMTGDLNFGDNSRAVFGDGTTFQIWHSGTNSHIGEYGTGHLYIQSTDLSLQSATGENYLYAAADGAVYIYHDNVLKFVTTLDGASIDGSLTVVNGPDTTDGRVIFGDGADAKGIIHYDYSAGDFLFENTWANAAADFIFRTNNVNALTVSPAGITVAGNITVSGTVDGYDVGTMGAKLAGIEAGATADQTITAGGGLTGGGTGDVTISHADTSTATSLTASGRRYVTGLTFDAYGHVTGYSTGTETVVDTNNYVTGLSWNATNGVLTATRSGLTSLEVDLDGRYLTAEADNLDTVTTRGNSTSNTITVGALNVTTNAVITGNLTVNGSVTTISTETIELADNIILLNSNETGTPTQSAGIEVERGTDTNVSFLWDETNDTWTTGSASITAGSFIGSFQGTSTEATTANVANAWAVARTLTLNGAVTGSVAWDGSANVSMTTSLGSALDNFVQWIAQDGDGTTYTITSQDTLIFNEGGGIDINFTADDTLTISHAVTSSQASVNNSNGVVIQDVTLDVFGHVTGLNSVDLDGRYLQAESDTLHSVTSRGNTTPNDIVVGSVFLGSVLHDDVTATIATTTQTPITLYSATAASGVKLVVRAKDTVTGDIHMTELLIANTSTAAVATEYGTVYTGSSLVTFDVDISGGNVRLLATGTSANSTQYNISMTRM